MSKTRNKNDKRKETPGTAKTIKIEKFQGEKNEFIEKIEFV